MSTWLLGSEAAQQASVQAQNWLRSLYQACSEPREFRCDCPVVDQAALHGLLRKLYDLGLPVLSVNRIEPDRLDTRFPH